MPWFSTTKQSLESPREVFLIGEPNSKKERQLLSISSSRNRPLEEKNKDRKLALVGIIPNQLFSLSSDKDRKTDSGSDEKTVVVS